MGNQARRALLIVSHRARSSVDRSWHGGHCFTHVGDGNFGVWVLSSHFTCLTASLRSLLV